MSCLTLLGIFPSFSRTKGRVCLRPTSTRRKCSTGCPWSFLRVGRTTHTLGRFPSPVTSNSSTLLLNVGVILDQAERRWIGKAKVKVKQGVKVSSHNTVAVNTVLTQIRPEKRTRIFFLEIYVKKWGHLITRSLTTDTY